MEQTAGGSLPFDEHQREAFRTDRNAVVMAGAGSGKTSVLAERFAWLLETGRAQIEEVLSLTFTRKATAEMVEKIYRRLKGSPDPAVRGQLARFDQAQISTLDSFSTQVVRAVCHRFGLPPDFRIEEEETRRLARETSFRFLLAHLGRPGLVRLLEHHGFDAVIDETLVPLALHHLPLPVEYDFPAMAERQVRALQREAQARLGEWEEARRLLLALPPRTATMRNNRAAAEAAGDLPDMHRQRRWRQMAQALEGLKLNRQGGGAEDSVEMNGLVDRLKEAAEHLALIVSSLEQEEALRELLPLLGVFQESFNEARRREGLLSFQDVAHLAVQALLSDRSLRQFYKERFRFIMIDEFQDNNRLQKDLLYLLAEKRERYAEGIPGPADLEPDKLFFVGDEKQSIYRFRGADVSVFKSLSDELQAHGGRTHELPTNYRSERGLILFFNRLFPRVMADARADFEARFRELAPRAPVNLERPEILLLYKPAPGRGVMREMRGEEVEAWRLAELIRRSVEERRLILADGKERRPAGYDDFALLLRSTGNQILYERVFRRFGIPYTTQNARSLFLEAPLYDFYQLLQLAVYPQDRLAYASLLRSPLVNVSDTTLLRLLDAGGPGGPVPFDLADLAGVGEEERRRLELGGQLWRTARGLADRVPLAELVDRLWAESGYACFILQDPGNHGFLEYQEYLLRMAERADRNGDNLAQFLDFIRENLGSYERQEELEVPKGRAAGVQILTIHRAKGLEFPVVVLADTGNRGRPGGQSGSPFYWLPDYGFTFNLGGRNYFARLGQEREEQEELAELKRLLYVALTRARSHLVLSGVHNTGNQTSPRAHLNMILAGLDIREPAELEEDLREYRFRLQLMAEVPAELFWRPAPALHAAERGAAGAARRPAMEELGRLYAAAGEVRRAFPQHEFSVTGLAARFEAERPAAPGQVRRLPDLPVDRVLRERELDGVFGSLTHELLQRRLLGIDEDAGGETADGNWLPEELAARIPAEHRPALLAEARRLADGFLDSELGRRALATAHRFPEYAFLHRRGAAWIRGRADLYFEESATAWVVDFKTDRSWRAGQFDVQLALYRLALRELTDRQVACRVVLLRSGEVLEPGEVPGLEEWLDITAGTAGAGDGRPDPFAAEPRR